MQLQVLAKSSKMIPGIVLHFCNGFFALYNGRVYMCVTWEGS